METLIAGYTITGELPSIRKNTRILDAICNKDNKKVVIKLLENINPSLEEIESFKSEYETLQFLKNNPNTPVALGFEKIQHNHAIIIEKIEAPSIYDILQTEKAFSVAEFIDLSIKIVKILSEIHQSNVIHKLINPDNILYNKKNNLLKIVGFSFARPISSEKTTLTNPDIVEHALPYLSPEQTGRMNRSIDYRSDFYSLGATFYTMLTGNAPFKADSPIELVRAHLSEIPPSPTSLNPEIPEVLSEIILKLLAKTAEDRYQSTEGLIADLQMCQTSFKNQKSIEKFTLATQDVFKIFHVPEKLYGRDKEISLLLKTYDKATRGKVELILVEGYAGIGKSALVQELYKPIAERHGYFISGKFDQFKHHVPYAALIQALNEWVEKILTENENVILNFKTRILNSVKDNGQIILDVIPELENIIGKQPEVALLEQAETQNRFHHTFQSFISAISTEDYPLAIFLDDLQWADLPSLNLLETLLVNPSCKHLLIIGAYRSNEVDATHPLTQLLENLNKRAVIYGSINLGPLSLSDVEDLISDLVHQEIYKIRDLADICYQKTNGNPFFLIQLLNTLHQEHLIAFKADENIWKWHIEKIEEKGISDNVVDLMINKIQELLPQLQEALQYASCIGSRFSLDLVHQVSKIPVATLFLHMQKLLEKGFIVSGGHHQDAQVYQFAHDRIQQAAHSLLDAITRNNIHLKLARFILKNTKKDAINDVIFEIIDHYNFSIDENMLDDMDIEEKFTIASLNLQASKLAKTASAYDPALKYVEYALYCMEESSWRSKYEFMIDLHNEAAETAYLSGKHKLMEFYADIIKTKSKNIYDEVKVIQTKVFSYSAQEKHAEALDVILNALRKLGTKLPRYPNKFQILLAVMKTKFSLWLRKIRGQTIPELLNLPEMTDHTKRIVIGLLKASYSPAYLGAPDLFPILVCQAIKLSLKYGNAKDSAYPYICFGMVCCDALEDIDTGYALGEMALKLNQKMHDKETATKLNLVLAGFVRPWKDPIREVLPKLLETYETGFENGDLEYGCYGAYIYIAYAFFAGVPIKGLIPKIQAYRTRFTSLQLTQALQFLAMTENGITPFIKEKAFAIPDLTEIKDISILFNTHLFCLMHAYLMEDYENALHCSNNGKKYSSIVSWQGVPLFRFYNALTLLAIYDTGKDRNFSKKAIKKNLKKLQFWATYAPSNFLHKALLVEAEYLFKIEKNYAKAEHLYKQAIELAKQNEYLHEEALANELLGKFYLTLQSNNITDLQDETLEITQATKLNPNLNEQENIASMLSNTNIDNVLDTDNMSTYAQKAKFYLNEAAYCYLLWGGDTKVKQLNLKYKDILKE